MSKTANLRLVSSLVIIATVLILRWRWRVFERVCMPTRECVFDWVLCVVIDFIKLTKTSSLHMWKPSRSVKSMVYAGDFILNANWFRNRWKHCSSYRWRSDTRSADKFDIFGFWRVIWSFLTPILNCRVVLLSADASTLCLYGRNSQSVYQLVIEFVYILTDWLV